MNTNTNKICICGKTMVPGFLFDYYCPDNYCPTNQKTPEKKLVETENTSLVKEVNAQPQPIQAFFGKNRDGTFFGLDNETTGKGVFPFIQRDVYEEIELRLLAEYPDIRVALNDAKLTTKQKGELVHDALERLFQRDPALIRSLRKEAKRASFGMPPIVTEPKWKQTLREALSRDRGFSRDSVREFGGFPLGRVAELVSDIPGRGKDTAIMREMVEAETHYTPEEGFKTTIGVRLGDGVVYSNNDIYVERAMQYYGVSRPEDVTSEMRTAMKTAMFAEIYGRGAPRFTDHMDVVRFPIHYNIEGMKNAAMDAKAMVVGDDYHTAREMRVRNCDSHIYMKRMLEWPKTMRVLEGGWGNRDEDDHSARNAKILAVMSLVEVPTDKMGETAHYDLIAIHPHNFRCLVTMMHCGDTFTAKFRYVRNSDDAFALRTYKTDIEICFGEDRLRLKRNRRKPRQPTAAERAHYRELMKFDEEALNEDARHLAAYPQQARGVVTEEPRMSECDHCLGNGTIKSTGVVCVVCKGHGSVMKIKTRPYTNKNKKRRF